ncbi:UDP-N-acetylmuramoyl-L-alanyl-D-glutamate--2,6-diaminopimelate ligase [Bacillus tianshenii]|nr:UDP-N-acetylmuramoyl-L-alanyl-D-glutamate--2,6-diaminopimelate ligase [Bacillus tianshenii]
MNIHELITGIEEVEGIERDNNFMIKGITANSLKVEEGFLFVAISGHAADGHDYIADAIQAGASLIVGEKDLALDVPYIRVSNSRKVLAKLASKFYGEPSRRKRMIGITGTNGKTTTSYMVKHILETAGYSCALFGSVKNIVNGQEFPSINTTPEPLELNRLLSESEDDFVIMEVSSHGISQHRIEGISFDYALFTNLDRDHLDYHKTMENYFETKCKLFDQLKEDGRAIIYAEDQWAKRLAEDLRAKGVATLSVGEEETNDIQLTHHFKSFKSIGTLNRKGTNLTLALSIPGQHNICNASLAYIVANECGVEANEITASLKHLQHVPGRFELMKTTQGITVVVDYAHTASAIYHCLNTAKKSGARRIMHVFGYRGNRDTSKREEMLAVSSKLSDEYILTLDDLNHVPKEIMEAEMNRLQRGCGHSNGTFCSDRTLAIKEALERAEEGDWVIITGKGNEPYQQDYALATKNDNETVRFVDNEWSLEKEINQMAR